MAKEFKVTVTWKEGNETKEHTEDPYNPEQVEFEDILDVLAHIWEYEDCWFGVSKIIVEEK